MASDEPTESVFEVGVSRGIADCAGGDVKVVGGRKSPGVSGCSFVPPPGVGMMRRGTVWCEEDGEDNVDDALGIGTLETDFSHWR